MNITEEVSQFKYYDDNKFIGYISHSPLGHWNAWVYSIPRGEVNYDERFLGEYTGKELAKNALIDTYKRSKIPQYTYCNRGLLCDWQWVINGGYRLSDPHVSSEIKNRVILWKSYTLPTNTGDYNEDITEIERLLKENDNDN